MCKFYDIYFTRKACIKMSEKKQFDELLGGSEKLPDNAHILKLASARASEMAAITYSLENPQQTKLIFQKLPVHMRRRVMSHNAKRMPRKLRISHLSQMKKSGLPPKTKRPSRKYRRRPQNLLLNYNKRQINKFWLETHIWHAKRFKMTVENGFKLANYSNDRCFRANYRAVTKHCLIQDISYYTCIEITGPIETLKENLKMHCNPNELTFGAKVYISGGREGTLMFYKKNGYPNYPIGYVHFLWKDNDSSTKAIWIWVHPAFYKIILEEIKNNFNFHLKEDSNTLNTESNKNQDVVNEYADKIPIYINLHGCQLIILRKCLNRFRLCGPLTLSILTEAFKLPNIDSKFDTVKVDKTCTEAEESSEKMDFESDKNLVEMEIENNEPSKRLIDTWFTTYYQSQEYLKIFKVQKDVFNSLRNLNSPNQLPPNMVLAITVLDPRFFLPEKRTKTLSNSEISETTLRVIELVNRSPLWDLNILNYVTKNFISTNAINNLRSQCLVPGVHNDQFYNEDIMQKIPILLIQKPGNYSHNNSIGFSSGIDIVLPAGWSMPFWLSLILRCVRVGGLREAKSIAYENSNLNDPAINHPDTSAYNSKADYDKEQLTARYFRLPPNKRVNYIKLGITSPFRCKWKLLMNEWNNVDSFYILRDHKILSILNESMCTHLKKKGKTVLKKLDEKNLTNLEDLVKNKNCFVPIKVTSESKGLPKDFAIICIPTSTDLDKYNEDKKWSGPIQSIKPDNNEENRRKFRKTHLSRLKQLKRRRIRAKTKMETGSSQIPMKDCSDIKPLNKIYNHSKKYLIRQHNIFLRQQAQEMQKLYLPECTEVRHSCDREVIGYVTQGGFSFSEAKGIGLGYVILSSILNFIKTKSNIVLVRNTTTRKFRICRLEILN